jgi:hypothetical protein
MSPSKKLTHEGTSGVYLSEALSLLGFCLGWSGNFVDSESGQTQRVKLLQQYSTPQPLPATHCLYSVFCILYFDTRKGGGGAEVNQRVG